MTKLKDWLDSRGITPAAFSRMVQISQFTIMKAYHGKPLWKLTNARKIAKFTNGEVTMKDLRGE